MKNDGTFPYYVTTFFKKYLPGQKNLSSNTIHSYSDSFKLMLIFCEEKKGIKSSQLKLENLDRELVIEADNQEPETYSVSFLQQVCSKRMPIRNGRITVYSWDFL